MRIKKIEVENFKSFQKLLLHPNKVNVLVGANASGKTNLLQVFEFLLKIKEKGIDKAVASLGGVGYIKNFNSNKNELSIKVEIEDGSKKNVSVPRTNNSEMNKIIRITEKLTYITTIVKEASEFIIKEEIIFFERFVEEDNNGVKIKDLSSDFRYSIKNTFGKYEITSNQQQVSRYPLSNGNKFKLEITTPFPVQLIEELNANYKKKSLLQYPGVFVPSELFAFGIYDFEPKKSKQLIVDAYAADLDKNGENLVLIIKEILGNIQTREQFVADISNFLGFIDDVAISRLDSYIKLAVKEVYNTIPTDGALLSDGTISIIATLVALYYQPQKQILFIEEPEKGIHPSLIANVMEAIYDAAEGLDKQVFITTHSPELLKHSMLEDIFLISRNDIGSTVDKPADDTMVNAFLKEELGVDSLFVDNLLNN